MLVKSNVAAALFIYYSCYFLIIIMIIMHLFLLEDFSPVVIWPKFQKPAEQNSWDGV